MHCALDGSYRVLSVLISTQQCFPVQPTHVRPTIHIGRVAVVVSVFLHHAEVQRLVPMLVAKVEAVLPLLICYGAMLHAV